MGGSVRTTIAIVLVILGCTTGVHAWDTQYDASTGLLPTAASPEWQFDDYGAPISVLDEALHIGATGGADYRREAGAINAGVPVTVETRMRVLSSANGMADLRVSTYSGELGVGIFPDHMVVVDRYYQSHKLWEDFGTFHTMRLAYDGDAEAQMWVDGQLALSWAPQAWGEATGPPGGVSFGSYSSDSYWQYVAYSKEFLPVPEPSSLAALGFALAGVGMGRLRRRR